MVSVDDQILELLAPLLKPGQQADQDTELVAELGLESLQVMELVESIEDHFDISVPLNVLAEVKTVGDLSRQIEALIGSDL